MRISFIPSFLTILILVFTACSSDDDAPDNDSIAAVIGTYTLTTIQVSPAQDIDEDGTASTNLLNELPCISGTLTINDDGSWQQSITRINVTTITGGLFFIDCTTVENSSGNWGFSNNQLQLSAGIEPAVFSLNGNTLTRTIGEDLPGFQNIVFMK